MTTWVADCGPAITWLLTGVVVVVWGAAPPWLGVPCAGPVEPFLWGEASPPPPAPPFWGDFVPFGWLWSCAAWEKGIEKGLRKMGTKGLFWGYGHTSSFVATPSTTVLPPFSAGWLLSFGALPFSRFWSPVGVIGLPPGRKTERKEECNDYVGSSGTILVNESSDSHSRIHFKGPKTSCKDLFGTSSCLKD